MSKERAKQEAPAHALAPHKKSLVSREGGAISEAQEEAEQEMRDFFLERWTDLCRMRSEGIHGINTLPYTLHLGYCFNIIICSDVLPRGTTRPVVRIRSTLVKNSSALDRSNKLS